MTETDLTHSITFVSAFLDVSKPTVRRYSELYAETLSSFASPPHGQERRYTNTDIRVLLQVKRLKADGMSLGDIATILTTISEDELPEFDPASPPNDNTALSLTPSPELAALAVSLEKLTDATIDNHELRQLILNLSDRIDEIDRKLDSLPSIIKRW